MRMSGGPKGPPFLLRGGARSRRRHNRRMGGAQRYPSMPGACGDGYRFAPPKQISSQKLGWAKRKRAHHQDVRSTIDGGHSATRLCPPYGSVSMRYVECTACGVSVYLCVSQDDSIAGTRPTTP